MAAARGHRFGADAGVDHVGRRHLPADPGARIVSLVPSITELLFDLGLGPKVVGRTTFCVHPQPEIDAVPRVGGTKTVRLDRLRRLEPTHVVVNVDENRRQDVETIEAFVPNVVVTHPLGPLDNPRLYALLGFIFGCEGRAGELAGAFHAALEALHGAARRLPPRRVLYLIWKEPWMTISRDTYISRTLGLVNWETVGDDPEARYPEVVLDERLAAETELVLLSSEPYPFKPEHAALVRSAPGWSRVPIALIDAEMVSWYGSRAIAGLEYLAEFAVGAEDFPEPLSSIMPRPNQKSGRTTGSGRTRK